MQDFWQVVDMANWSLLDLLLWLRVRNVARKKKKEKKSHVEASAPAVVMWFVMNDLINIILHRFPFMKDDGGETNETFDVD